MPTTKAAFPKSSFMLPGRSVNAPDKALQQTGFSVASLPLDLVNAPPILLGRDLPKHSALALESEYDALGVPVSLRLTREEVVLLPAAAA